MADGRLQGEMLNPTADQILDYMKILQVGQFVRGIPEGATMEEVLEYMKDLDD